MRPALLGGLLALAAGLSAAVPALAQDNYPSRPIRIIVPFSPGGAFQTLIQILEPAVEPRLGQRLVADYRPGAGGAIGARAVIQSAADGYTLMLHSSSIGINQVLTPGIDFDARTAFKPISNLAFSPFALVAHKDVPTRSLQELVAWSKANPGKLNVGSSGIGTTSHIASELMKQSLGLQAQHVPYKGSGPVITAIRTGEVQLTMEFPNNVRQHVDTGFVRFLAIAAPTRDKNVPDVPTFAEAGFPRVELGAWLALFAPAQTSDAIADKLNAAFVGATRDPQVVEKLQKIGYQAIGSTRAQLGELLASDIARFGAVVKSANIKAE